MGGKRKGSVSHHVETGWAMGNEFGANRPLTLNMWPATEAEHGTPQL
jgi:hypothetical protein